MGAETVRIERRGAVTVIAIDRPERRGAVDPATARALFAAFRAFDADEDARIAVLTGTGGAFCAGFDLHAAASGAAREWIRRDCAIPAEWQDARAQPLPGPMGPSRLWLSKPVIAAIEGHAVAGGLELAAWADMRVAARNAVFGVFCRRWGVPLIDGGTVRLPRLIGQGRANDLILTGRPVDAEEALRIGLADRVVPAGQALAAALALAEELLRFPFACMCADLLSARMDPQASAAALRREWQSAALLEQAIAGAARFAEGRGRGGRFDDL